MSPHLPTVPSTTGPTSVRRLGRWGTSGAYARALLEDAGVAITPGGDFDDRAGGHSVRLSFAAGSTAVAEAIDRIEAFNAR